jgi:hypothetical protein
MENLPLWFPVEEDENVPDNHWVLILLAILSFVALFLWTTSPVLS